MKIHFSRGYDCDDNLFIEKIEKEFRPDTITYHNSDNKYDIDQFKYNTNHCDLFICGIQGPVLFIGRGVATELKYAVEKSKHIIFLVYDGEKFETIDNPVFNLRLVGEGTSWKKYNEIKLDGTK